MTPASPATSFDPSRLVVALDTPDARSALAMADRLLPLGVAFKVGLRLMPGHGPSPVRALRKRGAKVFWDIKLHDIPSVVAAAVRAAAREDVELVTVHALGGSRMLRQAQEALALTGSATRLVAVTILTSADRAAWHEIGGRGALGPRVLQLARLARDAGLAGVVASPQEVAAIRRQLGGMLVVTPGVRPAGDAAGDQRREATPAAAIRAGADRLVVGRPILDAADPVRRAREILEEMRRAWEEGRGERGRTC